MWEAYSVGTIPVGAVVVDEDGAVVARGRNCIFDDGGPGPLVGTMLAHAELNALATLPSGRSYERYAVYTALEPCHLCVAAAFKVRIGAVRYASADPYGGGVGLLRAGPDHLAHPVAFEGPLPGAAGRLPELLHVAHLLWRVPDGNLVRFYRDTRLDCLAAAAALPAPDAGATLADALALVT
jgi:tRNA(Arg) A34 adenosine deaminase TadA